MQCRLCDSKAGWMGWDGDPDSPDTEVIVVCGLHMAAGDRRIEE